jgi:hypothetical protein
MIKHVILAIVWIIWNRFLLDKQRIYTTIDTLEDFYGKYEGYC